MPVTNKIILGTVQFGLDYGINNSLGKPAETTVSSILDLAYNNNIRLLDTAEAYGNAHEIIGHYHKRSGNQFGVITKFSAGRKDLGSTLSERIKGHLETLNVESLAGYMFHSANDFDTYFEHYKQEIKQLKTKGLIKKFGVSIYTNAEFEKLLNYSEIDFIQLPFNLLDNHAQRSTLVNIARAKGMEVHTRSVFLQGLFFKDINTLPAKLSRMKPYLSEIQKIAAKSKTSMADLALNYVVNQNNINFVLIGVDTPEQLQNNLSCLKAQISSSVNAEIDAIQVKEVELLNPANWNR